MAKKTDKLLSIDLRTSVTIQSRFLSHVHAQACVHMWVYVCFELDPPCEALFTTGSPFQAQGINILLNEVLRNLNFILGLNGIPNVDAFNHARIVFLH